jgi:predicted methyltransferase
MTDELLQEVAAAVGLREGVDGVGDVIRATARFEPVAVRKLSRAAALPVPIVSAICNELRKRDVVARERPVRFTPLGRAMFGTTSGPSGGVCSQCDGRGLVVPAPLGPAARKLAGIARRAPQPRFELDQVHCDVDTKVRRALALHEAGALDGRRVLLLGDDDVLSVALARLAAPMGVHVASLDVLDVDRGLVTFLRSELRRAPFRCAVRRHDLRDPLPESLRGAVDTVFTDPPYTVEGAELFLSRAAEAVAGNARAHVFLAFGSKRPDDELRLQRALVAMGFVTKQLVRDFNEYVGAGTLGGVSHLYHLMSTREVRPLVTGSYDGPLYTREARTARRDVTSLRQRPRSGRL